MMISWRDFRIGWRLLINEPGYSAVVITGLSIAMAVGFLLLGYVRYSFSYDAQVPDLNRVYTIKERFDMFVNPVWYRSVHLPVVGVVKNSGLAELVSYVHPINVVSHYQDRQTRIEILAIEPDFQKIFNIHAVSGDVAASLASPDGIAVTVSAAQKLFGGTQVLNKTIDLNSAMLRVLAVMPDTPSNTNRHYQVLVGPQSILWPEPQRAAALKSWQMVDSECYLKLSDQVRPEQLTTILQRARDKFGTLPRSRPAEKFDAGNIKLVGLSEIYFDETPGVSDDERGNKRVVIGLGIVALLILVIAATNYVNLSIVRTLRRQKEIGIHKVLGANAGQVARRFFAESVLVALFASCLGLLLGWLLLPWFSELMARHLDNLFTPQNVAFAFTLGLVTGLVTGLYPAWIAYRVNAAESLAGRGNVETRTGLWLRRTITVIQFSIAMSLAALTVTILWQTYYACKINPGYDPAHLLIIDTPFDMEMNSNPDATGNTAYQALLNQLRAINAVSGVAGSLNSPGTNGADLPLVAKDRQGQDLKISGQRVTGNFFQVYGIEPIAGRFFDSNGDATQDDNQVVLNWAAARALGFASPAAAIGQLFPERANSRRIIGIAPDIRLQSMREIAMPVSYIRTDHHPADTPFLAIKVNGEIGPVQHEVEKIWPRLYPGETINLRSAQVAVAESYADDVRLSKLMCAASLLAILLAAFGIYVLSAYAVQRRTREIVLRKLHGAAPGAIAILVVRESGLLLLVSALIGLPLGLLAGAHYLADFVERASMGGWPLLFAFCIASLVALCATLRQVRIAMRLSPVSAFAV